MLYMYKQKIYFNNAYNFKTISDHNVHVDKVHVHVHSGTKKFLNSFHLI